MKKTSNNLAILQVVFACSLIISNIVTVKTVPLGFTVFGVMITCPGAVVCYPITYLITDIIGEIWGKTEANKTVWYGLIGQIFAMLIIIITSYIPAVDENIQTAYDTLLGMVPAIVLGSMLAYIASQTWDVFIFHKIRDKYLSTGSTSVRARWIWNNCSTLTSSIIDTFVFVVIAFGFGFGYLFDRAMWPSLIAMIAGCYLAKAVAALIDTPFFYFFTRRGRQDGEDGETSD